MCTVALCVNAMLRTISSEESIKAMLFELLHAERNSREWDHWLTHQNPRYRWAAFRPAQFYMFGKPVQPVVSEEPTAPIKIDISAIPFKRELASKSP